MKNLKYTLLILLGMFFTFQSEAQKKSRIQPGRLYETGETLYAPRFGFTAKVPEGFQGMLPRESEVFLLVPTTETYGELYVFGRDKGNLSAMRDTWMKGLELSESIKLKAVNPSVTDDMLSAEVIAEGEYINKGQKGFAVSRCNPAGPCVTVLMVAPAQFYESVKNSVIQFISSSTFQPPSNEPPYADFDWKEFLSNKVLMTYASMQGGSKENTIHLCADGTFSANIKKSGIFKNQNPKYKGSSSGKWSVKGPGPVTAIQFTFDKKDLPMLEAPLSIKEEQVFSNDERYFVGQSDKCK